MSQHTEDQETLRRNARAEILANLPGVERELASLPEGQVTAMFVAAVAEYLRGEEELEREQERAAIGVVTWQRPGAGASQPTTVDLCPNHAALDENLSHVVRGRHTGVCAGCVKGSDGRR